MTSSWTDNLQESIDRIHAEHPIPQTFECRSQGSSSYGLSFERIRTEATLCQPPIFQLSEVTDRADTSVLQKLDTLTPLVISEEEARRSLIDEVRKHKSWRTDALKQMQILNITPLYLYRYSLQTFTETRKTYETCEAVSGGSIEVAHHDYSSSYGSTLDPWGFEIEPRGLFCEEEKILELPGSTKSSECKTCSGAGSSHCFHCRGSGSARCNMCNGTGMKSGVPHPAVVTHPMVGSHAANIGQTMTVGGNRHSQYAKGTPMHFTSLAGLPPPGVSAVDICVLCRGSGIKPCNYCNGSGKKPCGLCGGMGQIRMCTKMKVKFSVEASEFVVGGTKVPESFLKMLTGDVVFSDVQQRVSPISGCPINEINSQSMFLIQTHLNNASNRSRIIQQRHIVECIPINEVHYSCGTKTGTYFVVGNEKMAFINRYPKKCVIF